MSEFIKLLNNFEVQDLNIQNDKFNDWNIFRHEQKISLILIKNTCKKYRHQSIHFIYPNQFCANVNTHLLQLKLVIMCMLLVFGEGNKV